MCGLVSEVELILLALSAVIVSSTMSKAVDDRIMCRVRGLPVIRESLRVRLILQSPLREGEVKG